MGLKVNCIFQGGGANLTTLLCAAEALEQLVDEGFLEIGEVAGTSAGSIAAASLAHPSKVGELNQRIVSIAGKHISKFRMPKNRLSLAWKVAWGCPLVSNQKLESVIREFFLINNKPYEFNHSVYPLHISSADIRRSQPRIFRGESEKPLDEAITDSCSIPFVFKGHGSGSSLVDGGVMANLLDQSVFSNNGAFTLAFSFEKSGLNESTGLIPYSKSIVNSMVDNAVEQARVRILQSGGYVCELPRVFDTVSFSEALEKMEDAKFRSEMVLKCKEKIKSGLEDFQSNSSLLAYGDRVSDLNSLVDDVFSKVKLSDDYKVVECVIFCQANTLFPKSDPRSKNPDIQIKRVKIEPTANGIQLFRIGIARGSDFRLMNEISCRVYDVNGTRLESAVEVSTTVEENEEIHRLCVVLAERHSSSLGPLTVTMRTSHQSGLMAGLESSNGNEWMRAQAHDSDCIKYQDYLLAVPKDHRPIHLSDLKENSRRCLHPPQGIENSDVQWVVGAQMDDDELNQHLDWLHHDPSLRYHGWRARNIAGRNFSGVLIEQDIGD
ncbi:MAG: hypothetical protein QGI08_03770 [Paracoccaceae bacterium]|nr:hypothetical protein [Paracoccaceae bacterium]